MPPLPLLIPAHDLAARLAADHPPVVLDCGFDLADPDAGARAHAQAHVPGALYAHLDRDLAGAKTGRNGRHPLPEPQHWADRLAGWGITPARAVVVMDRQGGPYAARAWWLLRWIGVTGVAVLDGGWAAWVAAGLPQSAEPVSPRPSARWAAPAHAQMPLRQADDLQADLGRTVLIDARAPERFRGEREPLDPVAGHIPGALNRPFTANLAADGRFADPATLRQHFLALLGGTPLEQVVHQCGSGVTACHNLLAMAVAGLPGSLLYPGSWSEWCADPARPVARGG